MHFSPLSGASRQRPLPASDAKKRPFSQALRRDCIGKDGLYKIFVIENFSAVAPDCQKSPDRTTCAYGRDTDREIERRECARPFGSSARFGAQFCLKGGYQGGRFSDLRSRQKRVPPGACRFCDTLKLGYKLTNGPVCGIMPLIYTDWEV